MNTPDFDAASELIISFEGFVPFPYDDKHPSRRWVRGVVLDGTLTIGFGCTDRAVIQPFVDSGGEMTRENGLAEFRRVLPTYWTSTSKLFTTDLNPNQCAALTSLSYNAGPDGIRQFAPKLLDAINARRFDEAAELWAGSIVNAGTSVEAGLRRRRAAEAALFATPATPGRNQRLAPTEEMIIAMEFTYVFDGKDFLWLGAERIHTQCASAEVLESLKSAKQIAGLGTKSKQFHDFLRGIAINANFATG